MKANSVVGRGVERQIMLGYIFITTIILGTSWLRNENFSNAITQHSTTRWVYVRNLLMVMEFDYEYRIELLKRLNS